MIHPIVLYGDPILRQRAPEVPFKYNVKHLVKDMFDTMRYAKGCGLAAPQIGKSLQIFVVEFLPDNKHQPSIYSMINPVVKINEKVKPLIYEEGCLSIPGVLVPVLRKESLRVKYFDENWIPHSMHIDGFLARIILHEYDHLIGKLHIDYAHPEKMQDLNKNSIGSTSSMRIK